MNAIVGDNGIITRAQEANIQSSIASLEEFLQLKYTENYEQMAGYQSKIEGLTNVCSSYFYIPANEGIGALKYVMDSEGHALYLIKKSGLPEEIRESLVGGDAGEKSYTDYSTLNDVYGVTSNLKVYYCSGGIDSIKGLAKENLDNDDPLRVVFDENSNMSKFLKDSDENGDGKINLEESKKVTTLTITKDSGITSLGDLYNLMFLKELTLDSINLNDLSGLENCVSLRYLRFLNYGTSGANIQNYSALMKTNYLNYLYLQASNDKQVSDVFNVVKNVDYSNLQYLGIYSGKANVTDISILDNLTLNTKKAVKYLYLYDNDINSISDMIDYSSVLDLRVYANKKLETLAGVKNMTNLIYLHAGGCNLGNKEVYDESLANHGKNENSDSLSELSSKVNLEYVSLQNNTNLRWIGYLKDSTRIADFYLAGCENLTFEDVSLIKLIYLNCVGARRNISSKYNLALATEKRIDYSNQNLQDTSTEILSLIGNTSCEELNLSGNSALTNAKLQDVLSSMPNLKYLSLNNLSLLSSLDFVSSVKHLVELDLRDTGVTNLTILETNALELKSLLINNSQIDLTQIQKTLSRLREDTSIKESWFGSLTGIGIFNVDLYKNLEGCTELTEYHRYTAGKMNVDLDLSACKNLTYISSEAANSHIKIPASCKTIYLRREYVPDFSLATNFTNGTFSWLEWNQQDLDSFINSSKVSKNLQLLTLMWDGNLNNSIDLDFSLWNNFDSLTSIWLFRSLGTNGIIKSVSGLENFSSLGYLEIHDTALTSVPSVEGLNNLKNVNIYNSKVNDITSLKNLTCLETLNLSNNQISNLYALKNLTKLTTLNLASNVFTDTSPDDGGQSFNNLSLLAELNRRGALKNLDLSGCSNVTNFGPLQASNLTWTTRTGF